MQALLSSSPCSGVLARLASLAQIGELARRLLVNILYFPLFLGMVMYDNEFETKENKILTKD